MDESPATCCPAFELRVSRSSVWPDVVSRVVIEGSKISARNSSPINALQRSRWRGYAPASMLSCTRFRCPTSAACMQLNVTASASVRALNTHILCAGSPSHSITGLSDPSESNIRVQGHGENH